MLLSARILRMCIWEPQVQLDGGKPEDGPVPQAHECQMCICVIVGYYVTHTGLVFYVHILGRCAQPHITRVPLLPFTLTSLPLIKCVAHGRQQKETAE